jgi:hypothetical protein
MNSPFCPAARLANVGNVDTPGRSSAAATSGSSNAGITGKRKEYNNPIEKEQDK